MLLQIEKRGIKRPRRRLVNRQLFGDVRPRAIPLDEVYSPVRSPVRAMTSQALSRAAVMVEGDADQSLSPSTTAIDLASGQDAVAVYIGMDFEPGIQALPGMVNLAIDDGSVIRDIIATAGQVVICKVDDGAAVKIGAVTLIDNATPLELPYTVVGLECPTTIDLPSGSTVDGTIYCDHDYPVEWFPDRVRVVLPSMGWFYIDWTEQTQTALVYIREQGADGRWSRVRYVVLRPGRMTPVFTVTGRVGFCSPDGISINVVCPEGSILSTRDGDTLSFSNWWESVASGATQKTIQTSAEWDAAVTSMASVSSQWWKVSKALHGQSLTSLAGSFAGKKLRISQLDGSVDPDSLSLGFGMGTVATALNAAGGSNSIILVEGISIVNPSTHCINVAKTQLRMAHVKVRRDSGTKSAGVLSSVEGQLLHSVLFDVEVDGAQNVDAGIDDTFSITTAGGSPVAARLILVGCHGKKVGRTAGTENMNAITCHNQTGVHVYGGIFEGLGSGPFITGATANDPVELWGVHLRKGSGAGGTSENVRVVVGTSTSAVRLAIGCYTEDQGVWQVKTSILNECNCPTGDMEFWSGQFMAEDFVFTLLGNIIRKPDATGRGIFARTDSYLIVANHVIGFQQPFDFGGSSTATNPIRLVNNNTVPDGTVNVAAQPRPDVATETTSYLANVTKKGWTGSASTGAVRNLTLDLNKSTEAFQAILTSNGATGRNSITPVRNPNTAIAWLSSMEDDGTPVEDSVLDWDAELATLSPTDQATLSAMFGSLGLLDPNGKTLYVDDDKRAVGAYVISRADGALYPSQA